MRGGAALGAAAVLLAGCGATAARHPTTETRVLVARAPEAAALAPLPGGGLVFGERRTGVVREADARGRIRRRLVARVAVSTVGQRGLLGLAVDARGATFASWTSPDGFLLVGRVDPGATRIVWRGPASATLANGGHIAFVPGGRLVVGVGDLQQPRRVALADAPNGKLLALRASGPPDQRPRVLSGGWNNPFAFAWIPSEGLWVADNASGDRPERLAPGRQTPVAGGFLALPAGTAPSGLAPLGGREIAVCGVRSRRLERYDLRTGRRPPVGPIGPPLATDCALGVVRLADGRLAYATTTQIKVVRG